MSWPADDPGIFDGIWWLHLAIFIAKVKICLPCRRYDFAPDVYRQSQNFTVLPEIWCCHHQVLSHWGYNHPNLGENFTLTGITLLRVIRLCTHFTLTIQTWWHDILHSPLTWHFAFALTAFALTAFALTAFALTAFALNLPSLGIWCALIRVTILNKILLSLMLGIWFW